MKFYYYISANKLCSIAENEQSRLRGIMPEWRFLPFQAVDNWQLPENAARGVLSGLLDPLDLSWCTSSFDQERPHLENLCQRTLNDHDQKICLLEVSVQPGDEVYVADHRFSKRSKLNMLAYWKSLVPLGDYQRQSSTHAVPEVVCFSPISLRQIRINRFVDKFELINQIRALGDFPQHLPKKPVDDVIFEEILCGTWSVSEPAVPQKMPFMRLVKTCAA